MVAVPVRYPWVTAAVVVTLGLHLFVQEEPASSLPHKASTAGSFPSPPPPTKLFGPKMHKTGSTTLGGILARAANRHGWSARLYGEIQPKGGRRRFRRDGTPEDILYCHVMGSSRLGSLTPYEGPPSKAFQNYSFAELLAFGSYAAHWA